MFDKILSLLQTASKSQDPSEVRSVFVESTNMNDERLTIINMLVSYCKRKTMLDKIITKIRGMDIVVKTKETVKNAMLRAVLKCPLCPKAESTIYKLESADS